MNRGCVLTLLALSLAGARAGAVRPDTQRTPDAPAVAAGVYTVVFHLSSALPLPPGASVLCRAKLTPSLPGGDRAIAQPAAGAGNGPGASGQCAVEIPFFSPVNQASSGATLSYEIDALSPTGQVIRHVKQSGVPVPNPPGGSRVRVRVPVGL